MICSEFLDPNKLNKRYTNVYHGHAFAHWCDVNYKMPFTVLLLPD